jgi:hypothetical protein
MNVFRASSVFCPRDGRRGLSKRGRKVEEGVEGNADVSLKMLVFASLITMRAIPLKCIICMEHTV